MKLKLTHYLILLLIVFGSLHTNAQDTGFSQFYFNPLFLNPAFAGTSNQSRVSVFYRNQWPELNNAFVTYGASYDQPSQKLQGGLGIYLLNERLGGGGYVNSRVEGMYARHLRLSKKYFLSAGLQISYMHNYLNWNKLVFSDQIDPVYGINGGTLENTPTEGLHNSYIDFSAGALIYGKNILAGFSVHHLAEPNTSFYNQNHTILKRKYTLHMGTKIPIHRMGHVKEKYSLSPNIIIQKQGESEQFNYGLYVNRNGLSLGGWFRQNYDLNFDAFIIMVGFIQKYYQVAYSYDTTISSLAGKSGGAHEISYTYTFKLTKNKSKIRALRYPFH